MSTQFRLPRPAVASRLKKRIGPIVAVLMAALVLVPSAASGSYTDPAGDSGAAGDTPRSPSSATRAAALFSSRSLARISLRPRRTCCSSTSTVMPTH